MGFKCGIIGLPNVGKSSLFNVLVGFEKAASENYPFCTKEPNVGKVPIPEDRLIQLSKINNSKSIINAQMEFVDIAGLVKGASKGEGLGNKFLSHIREVDAIIHMIRCFDSEDIQNINPNVDPIRDLEIIETEMKLADLESIQKRLDKKNKKNVNIEELKLLETAQKIINEDGNLTSITNEFDKKLLKNSGLLITKPKLYVCNVDEESIQTGNNYTKDFINKFTEKNTLIIAADIENQINQFGSEDEKHNYMKMINMSETGLNSLIRKGYELLSLQTFFTSGPEETRAWTITKESTAPKAAGEIHSDFEKGFIRAETISYDDFLKNKGWLKSKEAGKMRLEGKDYIVNDGDILNFRFNT